MKREFRNLKTQVRVQAMGNGKKKIIGHAVVFNSLSEQMTLGGGRKFRERVMPGAFDKCLSSNPDIRGLVNHEPTKILGRTRSRTMSVTTDSRGVRYEIDPPDTSYANDLMVSMERGDIDQSSFGFYTVRDNWVEENGETIRELLEVNCFDVSPVTFPAYSASSSAVTEMRAMFPDGEPHVPTTILSRSMTARSRAGEFPIRERLKQRMAATEESRKFPKREGKKRQMRWLRLEEIGTPHTVRNIRKWKRLSEISRFGAER